MCLCSLWFMSIMTKQTFITVLLFVKVLAGSRSSVIGMAITPVGAISNSCRGNRFFSSPKRPSRLWVPPSLLCNHSFPAVKQLGREVNHSSPSSVEVKNEWSYTSPHPTCLHGVEKETLPLPLFIRVLADNSKHTREAFRIHSRYKRKWWWWL
jgi:hypothetical protein